MYAKFDSSNTKWSSREFIPTQSSSDYPYHQYPSIAINNAGELDVVWYGRQSPNWNTPYVIHHAERSGTSWKINWNIQTGGGYQYYPTLLYSSPNSVAKKGFAFVWYDNYYPYKLYMSEDFEFGKPKFTDGLGWCNKTVKVYNVEPKIDVSRVFTVPEVVKEQEEFMLHAEFERAIHRLAGSDQVQRGSTCGFD
jgi:hypothetical protein